ncbi:MAG: hypothetical protein R3F56_01855 [Planctomycetota bacterium]
MASRRTTHRSTAGKKLYAVRDAEGQFEDIQTYARAHAADLRQTSSDEAAAAAKAGKKKAKKKAKATAATKTTKKATKKKTAKKKAARKA